MLHVVEELLKESKEDHLETTQRGIFPPLSKDCEYWKVEIRIDCKVNYLPLHLEKNNIKWS